MKKLFALLLCFVMVFSMVACGASESQPAEETLGQNYEELERVEAGNETVPQGETVVYKDELVIGIDAALVTLNPVENASTANYDYNNLAYDRLLYFNETTMEFEPELATEWTWTAENVLELKLRDDVYFSDGSKFTADDVVYSLEILKDGVGTGTKLAIVDKVEAVDATTVKITLNSVNVDFLFTLSTPSTVIMSKAACEADPENGYYVTTGAWIVEDFVPSDYVTLKANENYWGGTPNSKTITMRYVAEPSARLIALQNGELDICLRVSEEEAVYAQEDPSIELTVIPTNTIVYFAFDTSEGPGADENLRLAIAHCLKKDDIIAAAANGYGKIAVSNWGHGTFGFDDSFGDYEYDLEKAKEYLAQAEYTEITAIVRGTKTRDVNALTVVQEQARQAGITINIEGVEAANLSEQTKFDNHTHEAVVYSYGWSSYGDDSRYPYYIDSNANKANLTNQEVMDLIDAAAKETDEEARKEMYAKVQAINHEHAYYLPMFYTVIFQGINKNVTGITWGNLGNDFTYACVPVEG